MKTSLSRTGLRAGLTTAVLLALVGCGGIADDAPTDADETEFCQAYYDETASAEDVADKLAEVGTPADISKEERNGFEIYVEGLQDEGDKLNKDVATVQIPADDKADGNAFVEYASALCTPLLTPTEPASPSEDGAESPSESPSEAPSESESPSESTSESAEPSETPTP